MNEITDPQTRIVPHPNMGKSPTCIRYLPRGLQTIDVSQLQSKYPQSKTYEKKQNSSFVNDAL